MHLLVLLLLAAPLASVELALAPILPPWTTLAVAIGGQMLVVLLASLTIRRCRRGLEAGEGAAAIRTAERWQRRLQWSVAVPHLVASLAGGLLPLLREITGDTVLLDEVLAILPPLTALLAMWWLWAPIEAASHDWGTLARVDRGLAVVPRPTRGAIVLAHLRTQVLLVLAPALVALAMVEVVRRATAGVHPAWVADVSQIGAVAVTLVVSPWIVRRVLDTVPLPAGPLREALESVGRAHGVRTGPILVWRTGLTLHNGAVVGFVPGIRCVLLTDALLEDLEGPELVAVMAHEVAHLRHRHAVVAVVVLMGTAALVGLLVEGAGRTVAAGVSLPFSHSAWGSWLELAAMLPVVVVVLVLFGWVSRRLERQADAFAARHLSMAAAADAEGPVYSASAVGTVCEALDAVARPSGMDPARHSWRHGSIRWRQSYLRSLVGRPLGRLPVDSQVRWIALLAAATLGVVVLMDMGMLG